MSELETSSSLSIEERSELSRYFHMLRIRLVEEAIADRYGEQEIRTPVHLCIGQEAPPVGVMEHLSHRDKILSGHRSHGHYLAKGGDLRSMLAELYGRVTGCSRGKGGSQHLVDLSCGFLGSAPILASTLSIGVGVAWALRAQDPGHIAIVFFGDAATEEGVFHEALSFASLHNLPIVFVCENNLYSTHSSLDVRQPMRPIEDLALAHALPSSTTDGNDINEVSQVAEAAITNARVGGGPTLLVMETYRWLEHVGPGSDAELGYRTAEEISRWMTRDPISRVEEGLALCHEDWPAMSAKIYSRIADEIEAAFTYAQSSPFPDVAEMLTGVYPEREN